MLYEVDCPGEHSLQKWHLKKILPDAQLAWLQKSSVEQGKIGTIFHFCKCKNIPMTNDCFKQKSSKYSILFYPHISLHWLHHVGWGYAETFVKCPEQPQLAIQDIALLLSFALYCNVYQNNQGEK